MYKKSTIPKMKLTSPELLDEYLSEQSRYSSDFKALVLRVYVKEGGDLDKTLHLTGVPRRTLYSWIETWNMEKENKKKP